MALVSCFRDRPYGAALFIGRTTWLIGAAWLARDRAIYIAVRVGPFSARTIL